MQKVIIYAALLLCLFLTKSNAQTFEQRANEISRNIQKITQVQKDSLKTEIENLENALKNQIITNEQFEAKKLERAEYRASRIEELVSSEEEKLSVLIKDKAEGRIPESQAYSDTITIGNKKKIKIIFSDSDKNDTLKRTKREYSERRTTSQFVLAFGMNNLIDDGDFSTLEDSEIRAWRSRFFEWGVTLKTRILPNSSLLQAKYGLTFVYNNLHPEDGQYFIRDGKETILVGDNPDISRSRFKNVYLTMPLHLEIDFSKPKIGKEGNKLFRTQNSVRLGLGGFVGVHLKTKNYYHGETKVRYKGNYNASDFAYGLSTYLGYGNTSLYFKYDLNPLFKNNAVDQNVVSFGVRFDID